MQPEVSAGGAPRATAVVEHGDRDGPVEASREHVAAVVDVLARRWRLVVMCSFALGAALAGRALLRPRQYTSRFAFVPQSGQGGAGLSGLAAQFGITVPSEQAQSPAFYVALLHSDALLQKAVETLYAAAGAAGAPPRGSLVQLLRVKAPSDRQRLDAAVRALDSRLRADVQLRSGVVEVAVEMPSAELARQVGARLLDLIDDFNQRQRVTQASAQRRFTQARLDAVARELAESESRLERFLSENREFQNSPGLTLAQDRLRRNVDLRQGVYTTLAQALEKAKIDEVRDTPVINVVDPPTLPARGNGRGVFAAALLGMVLGAVLGVAGVLWRPLRLAGGAWLARTRRAGAGASATS